MCIAFPNTGKGFSPLVEREKMDSDGILCPPAWLLLSPSSGPQWTLGALFGELFGGVHGLELKSV